MPEFNQKSDTRKGLLKYAVNILSRRPYFRNTLKDKLLYRAKREKFENSEEEIKKILDELAASGYLDDVYLAQAFVRRQIAKNYGPRIITLKLKQLHLDSGAIKSAIASEATKELQVEAIAKFAAKNGRVDKRKLSYKIYSRGFSSDIIKYVFDETEFPD